MSDNSNPGLKRIASDNSPKRIDEFVDEKAEATPERLEEIRRRNNEEKQRNLNLLPSTTSATAAVSENPPVNDVTPSVNDVTPKTPVNKQGIKVVSAKTKKEYTVYITGDTIDIVDNENKMHTMKRIRSQQGGFKKNKRPTKKSKRIQ